MPWTEVKPGLWQRSIGENEKFIKRIGDRAHAAGREHWSVTAGATFTLNTALAPSELSSKCVEAWCALRFEHPTIACTAEGDTLSYLVPLADSVTSWASETFVVHGLDVSDDDIVATVKPSRYTTAHLIPSKKKVLLHFAHWRTDGHGSLQLIDAFMDKLCRVTSGEDMCLHWGEEVRRLAPSIEEVLDLPVIATQDIVDSARKYMSTSAYIRGAAGVELMGDCNALPAGTRSARLSLAEADTETIMEACSTRNISLVSAVHASCAALTHSEAPSNTREKPYTSTMRFSLRPHLPKPYSSSDYAACLYTGGYMFRVPASQPWLENAKQYEEEYINGITADFLNCRRQYAIEVMNALQQNVPPPDPPQSEVDISSVGDAEALVSPRHTHGDTVLEVQDASVGVETLTRQTYCFLWTFRGHLELNLVYNEAYYDAGRAAKMVQRLADILTGGLELVCKERPL